MQLLLVFWSLVNTKIDLNTNFDFWLTYYWRKIKILLEIRVLHIRIRDLRAQRAIFLPRNAKMRLKMAFSHGNCLPFAYFFFFLATNPAQTKSLYFFKKFVWFPFILFFPLENQRNFPETKLPFFLVYPVFNCGWSFTIKKPQQDGGTKCC
jgi:hypothetical protein